MALGVRGFHTIPAIVLSWVIDQVAGLTDIRMKRVLEGWNTTSPAYQRVGDVVAAGDAYPRSCPLFGKVFSNELQVSVVDLSSRESPVDSDISISRFDTTERLSCHWCGRYTKESFRPPYIKGEP